MGKKGDKKWAMFNEKEGDDFFGMCGRHDAQLGCLPPGLIYIYIYIY